MKDTFKVARWEVKKILKSKTFIIMTFVVPIVILILGGVVGYFFARETPAQPLTIGLIDNKEILSPGIEDTLTRGNNEVIKLQESPGDYQELIKKYDLSGVLVIPEDILESNRAYYYFIDLVSLEREMLEDAVSRTVTDKRLKLQGFNPDEIRKLMEDVGINYQSLESKAEGAGNVGSMFLPFGLAMLMVFASMFSGGTLMQSIIKEKSSRIVELILSSISAKSLMAGKVIGFGLIGLLQVSIWAVSALIVVRVFFKLSLSPLMNVKTVYMLIYFLLGFILTASINAIVGAGMKEAQSGSQSTGMLVIIPIIPIYFSGVIINNPAGTLSKVFSYIPFTTATTMLIRLGFSSPPVWEITLTVLILLAGNLLLVRLAARIFRVGMLMYGKNASFKELFKWARS